jgi:predicted RNA-binding Zn ribbon-like protein
MTGNAETILELKRVAGAVALDFANTCDHEGGVIVADWLRSYADLLDWVGQCGLLEAAQVEHLRHVAARQPAVAADIFQQALALRAAIYAVFTAIAGKQPPATEALAYLNAVLAACQSYLQIEPEGEGFQWGWAGDADALDRPLWPLARAAADLLASPALRLLRQCPAEDCGWLFLDTSRNHTRRWCDMDDCGNRAKARRHYQRVAGG